MRKLARIASRSETRTHSQVNCREGEGTILSLPLMLMLEQLEHAHETSVCHLAKVLFTVHVPES